MAQGIVELLSAGEWNLPLSTVSAVLERGEQTSLAEGHRAMALALESRQSGIIAALLDHHVGTDFIDSNGRNAAHRLVSDVSRDQLDAWAGLTQTTSAAELFAKLRRSGVDLDAQDADGVTPLGLAAMAGPRSNGAFRHLIAAGASVNASSTISSSPDGVLHLLALPASKWAEGLGYPLQRGVQPLMFPLSVDDARVLLDAGAKPNSVDDAGNTPLMSRRYAPLLADLLVRGANPNHRNHAGQTPLMRQCDARALGLLLTARADPNAVDHHGQSVLHAHLGVSENLRRLLIAGAKPMPGLSGEALRRVQARVAASDVFAQLFASGADGNETVASANGLMPVWLAAVRAQPTQTSAMLTTLALREDFRPTLDAVMHAERALGIARSAQVNQALEALRRRAPPS